MIEQGGDDRDDTGAAALARFDALLERVARLRATLGAVVQGQDGLLEGLLGGLLSGGHVLLVGPPGLAKTLLVRTLAAATGLQYRRVQFTPDTMPSDVLGAELVQEDPTTGRRSLRFVPGPVFAQLLLADEINRTPPKTQSALLEAMAERQVTVAGEARILPEPFVVVATQNPIEQAGTYPLPEAQLDRFVLCLPVGYPGKADEIAIVGQGHRIREAAASVSPVMDPGELSEAIGLIEKMPVAPRVVQHAVELCRATRPEDPDAAEAAKQYVAWGAGPRAGLALVAVARARAAMQQRPTPTAGDVRALAEAVLRHRVVLNYAAAGDEVDVERVVHAVLQAVPAPEGG